MKINLIICICSIILWILEFIFFSVKINSLKKSAASQSKTFPKAETSFTASLCLTLLVELLPLIIPMKLFAQIIAALCGFLGTAIVFKERIANAEKTLAD